MADNNTMIGNSTFVVHNKTMYNIRFWWSVVIIPVGIVGNILCLLVVSQKKNRSISCNVYLGALAVCDSLVLVAKTSHLFLMFGVANMFICKASAFVQFTFSQSGSMIILALLIERVIAVTKPLQAAVLLSPKRSLIITIIFISLLGIFNVPQVFGYTAPKTFIRKHCFPVDSFATTRVYSILSFTINGVLPLFGILIMNLIILVAVKSSKKITKKPSKKRNMPKKTTLNTVSRTLDGQVSDQEPQIPSNPRTDGLFTIPSEQPALGTKDVDIQMKKNQMATRREKQLTIMTVVMTMAFFVCVSPYYVRILVFDILGRQNPLLKETIKAWSAVLVHCLMLLNSSINFFLYVMTGSKFRSDLKTLFCSKCTAK